MFWGKYQFKNKSKLFILPTSESHWLTFNCFGKILIQHLNYWLMLSQFSWLVSVQRSLGQSNASAPFKIGTITNGESKMGRHFDLDPFKAEPDLYWSFSGLGWAVFSQRLFWFGFELQCYHSLWNAPMETDVRHTMTQYAWQLIYGTLFFIW